jgi:hypothetical protein
MKLLLLSALTFVPLLAHAGQEAQTTNAAPFTLRVHGGWSKLKGPYGCTASISFTNTHARPIWFIMPSFANERFRETGIFNANTNWSNTSRLGADSYDQGHGQVVLVNLYTEDGFRAVLLPARGYVSFAKLVFESREPCRAVDLWEADALLVNGTTPLQDWLPYQVVSSQEVCLSESLNSGLKVLGYEYEVGLKRYPTEQIRFLEAHSVARYVVPLPE